MKARTIFCSDTCSSQGLVSLLLATTFLGAEDHDLDTPDHESDDQALHQEWHNHSIDDVVEDGGVEKKPDAHQCGNQAEDVLRSVEKVFPSHNGSFSALVSKVLQNSNSCAHYIPTQLFCQAHV